MQVKRYLLAHVSSSAIWKNRRDLTATRNDNFQSPNSSLSTSRNWSGYWPWITIWYIRPIYACIPSRRVSKLLGRLKLHWIPLKPPSDKYECSKQPTGYLTRRWLKSMTPHQRSQRNTAMPAFWTRQFLRWNTVMHTQYGLKYLTEIDLKMACTTFISLFDHYWLPNVYTITTHEHHLLERSFNIV